MESIIKDKIVEHLQKFNLLNDSQHGFMKGKSCLTNLLEYLENVTKVLDEGDPLDIIYLDFAKAFDKVPHKRLIKKSEAHGISGNVSRWIKNWLTDGRQRVNINGKTSNWADVLSGVPQGSVFGPLLFLIYINQWFPTFFVQRAIYFISEGMGATRSNFLHPLPSSPVFPPPFQQLGGLGERCKPPPPIGSGAEPQLTTHFRAFYGKE